LIIQSLLAISAVVDKDIMLKYLEIKD